VQALHAESRFEEALKKLEQYQAIVRIHYGTQSSEVRNIHLDFLVYESIGPDLQRLQYSCNSNA
jgi:hypothetical protein